MDGGRPGGGTKTLQEGFAGDEVVDEHDCRGENLPQEGAHAGEVGADIEDERVQAQCDDVEQNIQRELLEDTDILLGLEDVAPGEDVVEDHRGGEGGRTGDEVGHAQPVQHREEAEVNTEGDAADDEEAPELRQEWTQLLLVGAQEAFPPGRSCAGGASGDDGPPGSLRLTSSAAPLVERVAPRLSPKLDGPSEGPKLRRSPMTTRGLLTTRPLMLRMYSPRIPMKNS